VIIPEAGKKICVETNTSVRRAAGWDLPAGIGTKDILNFLQFPRFQTISLVSANAGLTVRKVKSRGTVFGQKDEKFCLSFKTICDKIIFIIRLQFACTRYYM
jgi:hypothetical protein